MIEVEPKNEELAKALEVVVYLELKYADREQLDVALAAKKIAQAMVPRVVAYGNGYAASALKKERTMIRVMLKTAKDGKEKTLEAFEALLDNYDGPNKP